LICSPPSHQKRKKKTDQSEKDYLIYGFFQLACFLLQRQLQKTKPPCCSAQDHIIDNLSTFFSSKNLHFKAMNAFNKNKNEILLKCSVSLHKKKSFGTDQALNQKTKVNKSASIDTRRLSVFVLPSLTD
jgi:hypothetical protein